MRNIGTLRDEKQARTFGDHLVASGIRNELERDTDGSWVVWIAEEDQVAEAQAGLERFRADPGAREFVDAGKVAAEAREAEAQELAAYRQRIRTRRGLFPKFGGQGVGILTYALIFACLVAAFYTDLGKNEEVTRQFFISDAYNARGAFLPEVFSGEIWRLFTPMFLHLGMMHILFNMLWLFQLGCMVEGRQGAWRLAALVAGTGLISNLAQYLFTGPNFGGMSGVVYGLAGYVWIRGKHDPGSGLGLDSQSMTMMLIWLAVGFTDYIKGVANEAHLAGLISGVVWGRVSAFLALRNPK